jgi:hypothetical protein
MQTTAPLSVPPARPADEQSRAREMLSAKFAQGHAFAQAEANLQTPSDPNSAGPGAPDLDLSAKSHPR